METKYKQAVDFKNSVENAFIGGKVKPHWIADTSCFWYRKLNTEHSWNIVMVNAETGKIEPAFDHEALANALTKQGIETTATTLPFRELEVNTDLDVFKFHIDDKLWQFESKSNTLSASDVEEKHTNHTSGVEPLEKEVASGADVPELQCSFTFFNKRSKTIRIWWIDYEGQPTMSKTAEPGKSCRRYTYNGHVWRVCDDETGDVIASYATPYREIVFVTIDDDVKAPLEKVPAQQEKSSTQCVVKDSNVYVTEKGLPDIQLSSFGSKDAPFDVDHVYHSRDGKYACVWQNTPEQKRIMYRLESTPDDQLQPRVVEKQYLKPGDKVRIDRPRIFDLTQKREIPTSDALFGNPYVLEDVGWSSDSQKYRFIYNERGHKVMRVVELDINGNTRTLVEERQATFIDYSEKIQWRDNKDTDELLWTSERDGSNHLYLYKLDGSLGPDNQLKPRQLTHGACNVYSIERADFKGRQVYVKMLGVVPGQDPYYMHLVRIGMDDGSFTLVTEGDGNHEWTWSPDFKYFVDEWSRVDTATQTILRDAKGKLILEIDQDNLDNLFKTGWKAPERFTAPSRDGVTPIYGIIIKPSDFSPDKHYPIIEEIYAGPHGFSVPKSFSRLLKQYALAELGFIVVQIDGMGTNWRCRTFHEICYKNLKDAGLPDRIAWLKAAAKTRPWMDITRVGIYGGSAGGQNAMSALLWHGDFYKAAIADCGCHDNRLDKLWWNEQWMGWPVDKSYEENSNIVNAHRLKGALMLILGEMDDNVDPSSTLQVVHALNKAAKDYELLFVPGGGHGAGDSTRYFVRRQWDFFVRHLIGAETPRWNSAEVREKLSVCYDG